jgi:16S rRNA (guanine(1405)-N(7))-methyltransferase
LNKKPDLTGVDDLIEDILTTRKYRGLNIPQETARDIYSTAIASGQTPREAEKTLRQKLHNIVAPYLGEPDFDKAYTDLETVFSTGDPEEIKKVCGKLLSSHASSRERLEILDEFYPRLFCLTGKPGSIFDLASGLNPLSLPWMDLDPDVEYYAYDLNEPRIKLINRFFEQSSMKPLGFHQDILIHPPLGKADLAFLFKEAHRMEQRQRGCTRKLIEVTGVDWFLLSLPTSSLNGKHDLIERQRRLVGAIVAGTSWQVTEILFSNEIVFCINKGDQ